ncbi:MAG: radical SAM protein [Anaerolineales bacterium]|nr:radical SAM protein [Anaerolineales bacterium]
MGKDAGQTQTILNLPPGVPPLTSIYLYAAGSCNLACRHCWISPAFKPNNGDGAFIPVEWVEKAIREALPLGLRQVKFTGGEPTTHPEFRQLIHLARQAGLGILIETNGTLVDESLAHFLKEQRVGFVSVSLDGARAETHEWLRMVPGSFGRAVQGVRALVSNGIPTQLIFTIHTGNVGEIDDFVRMAQELGCNSVKFNHVQKIGRGERFAKENGLGMDEVLSVYHRIEIDIARKYRIPVQFDIPYAFLPIRRLLAQKRLCSVQNILGLLSGGELALCGIGVNEPDLVYGRVEQDDLVEVWTRNEKLTLLRELIPMQLEGICTQCIHRYICQGHCVASNYHLSGKLNAPYWFCDLADGMGLFPSSRKIAV